MYSQWHKVLHGEVIPGSYINVDSCWDDSSILYYAFYLVRFATFVGLRIPRSVMVTATCQDLTSEKKYD